MEVFMFLSIMYTRRIQEIIVVGFSFQINGIKYVIFCNIFLQIASDLSSMKFYKRNFKRIPWKKFNVLSPLQQKWVVDSTKFL